MTSKSFKERFKILLGKYLEDSPNIKLKDTQRFFDEGQKLAIYYRDRGNCQICGNSITYEEAEFDHKISWKEGSETIVSNGQLLCIGCNRRKGASLKKY